MADSTTIKSIMDGAIDSWESKTEKNIVKLVVKIIDEKCASNFDDMTYAKSHMYANKTSEQLKNEISTMYANGQDVDPDEVLSEGLETMSSIISLIPGTTYVTNVLTLGNDILVISDQMVKDYVAQYEQLEAMIDGVEENGADYATYQ